MSSNRIGVRDLRNKGGDLLARVQAGERLIVTKSGRPVAEVAPLRGRALNRKELLARWRKVPQVDASALREDLEEIVDSSL